MSTGESPVWRAFLLGAALVSGSLGASCAAIVGADFDQIPGADAGESSKNSDGAADSVSSVGYPVGTATTPGEGSSKASGNENDASDWVSSTSGTTSIDDGGVSTVTADSSIPSDPCNGVACSSGFACNGGACVASEILLFGGTTGSTTYGDTWLFDGTNWNQQTGNGPPARFWHAMATLNGEVVLFGGNGTSGDIGDTWTWDSAGWTQLPISGPSARNGHAMAVLGNEIVLFGGTDATGYLSDTWIFDGSAWSQLHPSVSPAARTGAAMALVGSNLVLFGGETAASDGGTSEKVLEDTWTFNGETWTRIFENTPPQSRGSAAATTLGDSVLLFGGEPASGARLGALADSWTFSDSTNTWAIDAVNTTPPARLWQAMATINGQAVMVGGWNSANGGGLADMWTFEHSSWTSLSPAQMPQARWGLAMAAW